MSSPTTTMDPPVQLSLPRKPPSPASGCGVCAALAEQRSVAYGDGDMSAVSDCNVELAAHPKKEPPGGAVVDMQTWRDGRRAAVNAAEAIREVLASLGLPESAYVAIRPQVTHKGQPLVHLGSIPAAYVEQIAEALRGTRAPR